MDRQDMASEGKARHGMAWQVKAYHTIPYHTMTRKGIPYHTIPCKAMARKGIPYQTNIGIGTLLELITLTDGRENMEI